MTSIELDSVGKVYDLDGESLVAVEDLDISIEDGEFMVFVGPSGCGKTTTLRCIAGREAVSSGTVTFDDRDVTDRRARDRDVAMVFQDYALYPHMTVRRNIGFGLRLSTDLPEDEIEAMVEDVAAMLGIVDLLDQQPNDLSGGQQQRVALGRAIVREPAVFLLDEPLSNLDAKLRDSMRKEILQLQQELDVTSVYVTHDQTEAMAMGDRVAVMNDGELQQVGPPEAVYRNPVNRFVAGFLGSPSMNFLEANVERSDDEVVVDGPGEFALAVPVGELPAGVAGRSTVVVGIRPEDLAAVDAGGFATEVTVVEAMGDENVVYADCGGEELTARVESGNDVSTGDRIDFDVPVADLYLFDPATEESLKTKDAQAADSARAAD